MIIVILFVALCLGTGTIALGIVHDPLFGRITAMLFSARKPALPDAPAQPAPPRVGTGAAGATPAHYRAFSLLSVRTAGDPRFEKHLAAFRTTAKTIRDERDPVARDAALKVLDHFVGVAQAYADAWDDTPEVRRAQLRNKLKPTLLQLHQALKDALAASNSDVAKALAVEQRFVEIRYGEDAPNYGLALDTAQTVRVIPPYEGEIVGLSAGSAY